MVTAISAIAVPALSAYGVWIVTRWQLRREHAQRDREHHAEHEQQRLREFRTALANWAASLYKSTENQRSVIFALKNVHRAHAATESAEQSLTMGLLEPDRKEKRERELRDARARLQKTRDDLDKAHAGMLADALEVRTTSFQAAVHAPSLDLKKEIRDIISSSNLDAMTRAMLSQYDPAELDKIAQDARPEAIAVMERVHALIDAQR